MLLDFKNEFSGVLAGNCQCFVDSRKIYLSFIRYCKMDIDHWADDLGNMSYQS